MRDITKLSTPTAAPWVRNAVLLAGFGTFALFIHAWFVDVAIHPMFFSVGVIVLFLLPGTALSVSILFRRATANPPEHFGFRDFIGAAVCPFFIGFVLWVPLAKTPAWLAATFFGTPHDEVREFFVYTSRGKYECDYRAEPTDGLRLFPDHLCLAPEFAGQHHRQRVLLRLTGDRTPLGFRITHFEKEIAP